VRSFDEAICARIVAADSDVSNVVSFREIFEGCEECGAVVGDDSVEGSPSAYDVFEDPVSNSFSGFVA
jgi:hypothetical protein